MRKLYRTQTQGITWSASGQPQVELDNSGLTTEIVVTAEITPSATLTAANQPSGLLRVGRNFRVEGGGNTFFSLPDEAAGHGSTILYYLNRVDYHRAGHPDGVIAAPQRTYTPITWWLHAGSRTWNPFDLSAFVPGLSSNRTDLTWITTANTVMDDTVTLASAVLRISSRIVLGTESEVQAEMMAQGVSLPQTDALGRSIGSPVTGMIPSWTGNVEAPSATATDYSSVRNLPVGGYLRRITVASQDATAARPVLASDVAVQLRIKVFDDEIVKVSGDELMNSVPYGSNLTINSGSPESAATEKFGPDFNNHAPRGIMPLDLRPFGHSDYGLNLIGVPGSSAELGLTILTNTAGDDIFFLYERTKMYHGALGFHG